MPMKEGRRVGLGVVAALVSIASSRAEAQTPPPASPPVAASAAPAPVPAPAPAASGTDGVVDHDHPAPNSIYVEGLGAAIGYSINYERLVLDPLAVRVGFSYLSLSASAGAGTESSSASATYLFFPITASYIGLRSGKHSLELGGGVTLLSLSGSANALGVSSSGAAIVPFGVLMVGYRFHPVDHAGFQFRIGFNALIGEGLGLQNPDPSKLGFIPWPYLSLGASF
jgi:hypothetical protein